MNKQDLIGIVAETAGLGRGEAARAVDALLEAVTAALRSGEAVRLTGFGTFELSQRKASTGRNPRTGEPMQIMAGRVPKFRAGKSLKDAVA